MNLLDRAISFVSPEKAEARARARARLDRSRNVNALYQAASLGRRTAGWRAVDTDANSEVRSGLVRLRSVAREMVRDNAYASRGKAVIARNTIGAGIIPQVKAATEARTKQIADLFKAHFDTTACDADGRYNLYGLQDLAMASIVESGEVLIRKRPRRREDGFPLPFQLQVLEADFLDLSVDGAQSNGNYAVQGIEFDLIGRRVAYHIYSSHPGGQAYKLPTTSRVPAEFVAHIYRADRPGQVRGVTWFAPVIMRLRDYADYCDAQLMRQKIAACFAAFVTTADGAGSDPNAELSATGFPIEQFEPGMIERLGEGETVSFATPPGTADFGPYSAATLREVAIGLGVTAEALTGDLSGVNFSSGRMGWLEFQRNIESWQWNMLIPQMCDPIGRWGLEAAYVMTGSDQPATVGWTPPRREMINPAEEITAARDAIRAGLSSRSNEQRRLGFDPADLDAEITADNARADDLELIFDSDPRKVTTRGVAQKDADPNAPDTAPAAPAGQ